jgi:hypothetical protein
MANQHNIINGPYIAAARKKGLKPLLHMGASNQILFIYEIATDMLLTWIIVFHVITRSIWFPDVLNPDGRVASPVP